MMAALFASIKASWTTPEPDFAYICGDDIIVMGPLDAAL